MNDGQFPQQALPLLDVGGLRVEGSFVKRLFHGTIKQRFELSGDIEETWYPYGLVVGTLNSLSVGERGVCSPRVEDQKMFEVSVVAASGSDGPPNYEKGVVVSSDFDRRVKAKVYYCPALWLPIRRERSSSWGSCLSS